MKISSIVIMVIMFSLLVPVVLGMLSVKDLEQSAKEAVIKIDENVYIKPDGPLDLVHSFICKEKKQIDKKRLFSPGLEAYYSLKNEMGKSTFKREGSRDVPNTFDDGKTPISKYFTEYYNSVKAMYNVVNGEANIYTNQERSLYKLLTKNINEENADFQVLAALLLLTEGVNIPLEVKNEECTYIVEGQEELKSVPVLRYEGDNGGRIKPIRIELSITTEKGIETLDEIADMLKFFICYGGKNIEKLSSYVLMEDDTPSFLIRSYIFEFIQDLNDARLFFEIVNDMLISSKNIKGSKTWEMFFTTNKEEVSKHDSVHDALKIIDKVIAESDFPFSINFPPPDYTTVEVYNKEKDEFIKNSCFSDRCDIAIYTLLSCLLYDPTTNTYSLSKLESNGYKPTENLRHFFENFCVRPTRDTPLNFHQEWARVIQDLVLTKGELMGNEESGDNTIQYCTTKEIDGKRIGAGVETDILNILKVVAKVTGMAEEKMRVLGEICEMVENGEEAHYNIEEHIGEFTTTVFNEISVMYVELGVSELKISLTGNFRKVYGDDINIRFRRIENGELSKNKHVLRLSLNPKHGEAYVIPENDEIKREDRKELEKLAKECGETGTKVGNMVVDRIRELLSYEKFKRIPEELVRKVEKAENDVVKYSEINNLLNICKISTIDEKLYIIDLFAPYLQANTGNSGEQAIDNETLSKNPQGPSDTAITETNNNKLCKLKPNDPVVQLISNIMASVPLNDEATQYYFVQIFTACNGKYNALFPNIQGDICTASILERNHSDMIWGGCLSQFIKYNVPNILNGMFNEARNEYGDSFFEMMLERMEEGSRIYSRMAKKCVRFNSTAAIKAIREDFRIRKDIIELGLTEVERIIMWFDITLETEYYEGLIEVCDSWECMLKKKDEKLSLMKHIQNVRPPTIKWDKLLSDTVEKLCTNVKHKCALMEMCLYCANEYDEKLDKIYAFFITRFTPDLCHLLLDHIAGIIENLQRCWTELAIPEGLDNESVKQKLEDDLRSCKVIINNLKYFTENIAGFVKGCDVSHFHPRTIKEMEAITHKTTIIISILLELEQHSKAIDDFIRQ